jgi:hypothetical protein
MERDLFPITVAAGLARQPVNKLFSAVADYPLKNYKRPGVGWGGGGGREEGDASTQLRFLWIAV